MSDKTPFSPKPRLPAELIVTVAECLAGDLCYKSLANLNVVSGAVHRKTLSVLYTTMVRRYTLGSKYWIHNPEEERHPGWKYVRYLVVDMRGQWPEDYDTFKNAFPSLRLAIIKTPFASSPEGFVSCFAALYGPVSFDALVETMLSTARTRQYYSECEPDNPYFDFAPPTWDALTADGDGYIPEKLVSLEFQDGGRIQDCEAFASGDASSAWTHLTTDFTITFVAQDNPQNNERWDVSVMQVLEWMFLFPHPQRSEDSAEKPKCDIWCRPHHLPGIMSAIGALHVGTSIKVHAGDFRNATTLKRILDTSAARYIYSRQQYLPGLPRNARNDTADLESIFDDSVRASHSAEAQVTMPITVANVGERERQEADMPVGEGSRRNGKEYEVCGFVVCDPDRVGLVMKITPSERELGLEGVSPVLLYMEGMDR